MESDSLHVYNWRDLQQFGIGILTGESCAFSMRLLCDVSAKGRTLVLDYLGLPFDTQLARNWNGHVGEEQAVGSVMLHRDSLKQIAEFAMFAMGVLACVYTRGGEVMGIFDVDLLTAYENMISAAPDDHWDLRRNYRCPGQPSVGSRNVHAMTGRSE
jgi:hypothetical protein